MALITVPKPPKSAYNPDRPATSLLKAHVEHMREAESKLPLKYRSEFYAKAVRTEGEAAEYIRDVTDAIHEAHHDAERRRARKGKRKFEIAAAADKRPKNSGRARKRPASQTKKSRAPKGPKK